MKHSKNRPVREALCRARCTRASEGALDNTPIVAKLLALRQELAELLGYKSYAEVSLAEKSAPSVAAVESLIAKLADASRPFAVKEDAALDKFAQGAGWTGRIEPWDRAYWNERQREKLYSYSEEELSKYFDLPVVLDGLFRLATRLFGITVEPADGEAPVWHPDVRFYRVRGEKGNVIAHFYFDPYSRPATKRGGAWAHSFRSRMRLAMNSGMWLSPTCAARAITSSSASCSRRAASRNPFTAIPARIARSAIAPNARMRSTCIR